MAQNRLFWIVCVFVRRVFELAHQFQEFHSGLDFVSVHDALLDQFRPILEEPHGRISSEARLDAAAKRFSSGLSERPSLANVSSELNDLPSPSDVSQLFKAMLHRLLGGNALSDEDLLDVLTLKDNRETPMNFDTAVNLLDGGAVRKPRIRLQPKLTDV